MGYKASMIIVKKPSAMMSDQELLKMLGYVNVSFLGETFFDQCMLPHDNSINIGSYNDCLIITDDFQLTTSLDLANTPQLLGDYEKVLTDLYPDTEVLTVACHSTTNYHLYSLVKNGQKLRFKMILDGQEIREYGDRIEEEERIYAKSQIVDGERLFKSRYSRKDIYEYTEDQLMEEFAFGVAKRHLGVMISTDEDEKLMFATPFKKYAAKKASSIAGYENIDLVNEVIKELKPILISIKEKVNDESDLICTSFYTPLELRNEIDKLIAELEPINKTIIEEIKSHFSPGSTFDGHAMANGWTNEYSLLAERFDNFYNLLNKKGSS